MEPHTTETASDKSIIVNPTVQNYPLILKKQPFLIDLVPIELGSVDTIVSMDWLTYHEAEII